MSEGVDRERKRAMWRAIYHAPREDQRHQSGGLAVALAKLNLDALTVADAVADVAKPSAASAVGAP